MQVTRISLKVLKAALKDRYTEETIKQIHKALYSYADNETSQYEAHCRIDQLLNNHGIEGAQFKIRGRVRTLYYSNSGDSYGVTVMRWRYFDGLQEICTWMVGSWGDIAEKYPEAQY